MSGDVWTAWEVARISIAVLAAAGWGATVASICYREKLKNARWISAALEDHAAELEIDRKERGQALAKTIMRCEHKPCHLAMVSIEAVRSRREQDAASKTNP